MDTWGTISEILASVSLNLERTRRCFSFQLVFNIALEIVGNAIWKEKKKRRNKHKKSRCMHMIHVWKWCHFIPGKSNPTNKLLETIRKEKRWLNTKLIFKIHDSTRADIFIDTLFKDILRSHGIREKIYKTNYALSNFFKKKGTFLCTNKYSSYKYTHIHTKLVM